MLNSNSVRMTDETEPRNNVPKRKETHTWGNLAGANCCETVDDAAKKSLISSKVESNFSSLLSPIPHTLLPLPTLLYKCREHNISLHIYRYFSLNFFPAWINFCPVAPLYPLSPPAGKYSVTFRFWLVNYSPASPPVFSVTPQTEGGWQTRTRTTLSLSHADKHGKTRSCMWSQHQVPSNHFFIWEFRRKKFSPAWLYEPEDLFPTDWLFTPSRTSAYAPWLGCGCRGSWWLRIFRSFRFVVLFWWAWTWRGKSASWYYVELRTRRLICTALWVPFRKLVEIQEPKIVMLSEISTKLWLTKQLCGIIWSYADMLRGK